MTCAAAAATVTASLPSASNPSIVLPRLLLDTTKLGGVVSGVARSAPSKAKDPRSPQAPFVARIAAEVGTSRRVPASVCLLATAPARAEKSWLWNTPRARTRSSARASTSMRESPLLLGMLFQSLAASSRKHTVYAPTSESGTVTSKVQAHSSGPLQSRVPYAVAAPNASYVTILICVGVGV